MSGRLGMETARRAVIFTLLAMIFASGVYLNVILRSLEQTLPTTLLGQLEYLNRITNEIGRAHV